MVELRHALEENGIARGPLLNNKCDKHDVSRLHLLALCLAYTQKLCMASFKHSSCDASASQNLSLLL